VVGVLEMEVAEAYDAGKLGAAELWKSLDLKLGHSKDVERGRVNTCGVRQMERFTSGFVNITSPDAISAVRFYHCYFLNCAEHLNRASYPLGCVPRWSRLSEW
jgi:hypothetical protein